MTVEFGGGESSPAVRSSAESNFRELDDAFLQTQTRIWLGEVLRIRFDEETNICDILADGELLFELSEVLLRMSPTLPVDATQSKSNESKSLASNKSTRRYMPYYNVGSFLKMCKSLGLDGIDLFSPSDVVEKRNTRKVCMCLRSLSKKARSRNLNVPDFDSVTRTLSMPTDMVECIRKSLEMSQCSSSLSVGDEVETPSRIRYWNRISGPASAVSNGYSSDICDDADSSFVVGESKGTLDYTCDVKSPNISCLEAVRDYGLVAQLNVKGLENEDDDQCEYLSPSIGESVGSPCSQYFSDQEVNMASSDCFGSHIRGQVELISETKPKHANDDSLHVPIDWEVGHINFGDLIDEYEIEEESDCVSEVAEDTDIACINGGSSAKINRCGVKTLIHPSEVECEKSSCVEKVSCTNKISLEGRDIGGAGEYTSEDDFDGSGFQIANIEEPRLDSDPARHSLVNGAPCAGKDDNLCYELIAERPLVVSKPTHSMDISYNGENHVSQLCTEVINGGGNPLGDSLNNKNSYVEDFPSEMMFQMEPSPTQVDSVSYDCKLEDHAVVKSNDKEARDANMIMSDHHFADGDASRSADMSHLYDNGSFHMDSVEDRTKCSENGYSDASNSGKPISDDDAVLVNSFTSSLADPQPEVESPENVDSRSLTYPLLAENMDQKEKSDDTKQEDASKEVKPKPQRKLLKSVVKGTALVGIAVFLLHLRKSKQENLPNARKQPAEVVIQSTPMPSPKQGQKGGNTSSVYPAEKLNFGM